MKDQEIKDELIWSYMDNSMNANQKDDFEKRLNNDAPLKVRFEELTRLNDFTKKGLLQSPSSSFTEQIMLRIQYVKIRPKRSHWLILIGVLVTILIGGLYLSEYKTDLILDLSKVQLPSAQQYLPKLNVTLDKTLPIDTLTKGLLYTMSFLSLLFFDKAILKPYFKNRKMSH